MCHGSFVCFTIYSGWQLSSGLEDHSPRSQRHHSLHTTHPHNVQHKPQRWPYPQNKELITSCVEQGIMPRCHHSQHHPPWRLVVHNTEMGTDATQMAKIEARPYKTPDTAPPQLPPTTHKHATTLHASNPHSGHPPCGGISVPGTSLTVRKDRQCSIRAAACSLSSLG